MEYKSVKGTRDFLPLQMQKRNYIFDTIKQVYRNHGFLPIETPAMENLQTLMGKYGDEGDKLLFKILDSGNFLREEKTEEFVSRLQNGELNKATKMICEKGLRYDLTVPFARFVVNHQNDIVLPFKRYQIQPVWRADRPQKGRYREFYQCDADVIGSNSLMNEVELLQIIDEVFTLFGLPISIKLNNRKILAAFAQMLEKEDCLTDLTVAIDKLDKIGQQKVLEELKDKGFSEKDCNSDLPILNINGNNAEKIAQLHELIGNTEIGKQGLEELQYVLEKSKQADIKSIEVDLTLARGLNYYTGAIIEVKALDVEIGSITGGGRYDNLTGIFGMPGISGVGISFGADRIYDCLEEKNLFPENTGVLTSVLFINFGEEESNHALRLSGVLRKNGISCEIYPESVKMKKQMKYANDRKFPYVIMIGEEEIKNQKYVLKDMVSGEQFTLSTEEIIEKLK
ncbi:MAG: histidine--tRNA ligase [Bacteroidales bacterium]|nr:histidine--tRNA ligase [Bacteroidales bacterium]